MNTLLGATLGVAAVLLVSTTVLLFGKALNLIARAAGPSDRTD